MKHELLTLKNVGPATIHEAKTGEKTPWWEWSKVRKSHRS